MNLKDRRKFHKIENHFKDQRRVAPSALPSFGPQGWILYKDRLFGVNFYNKFYSKKNSKYLAKNGSKF
jgi:hypothetical protein